MGSALDADVKHAVQAVHDSPTMAVVAVAGAGGQALAWLLAVPGASRTILEGIVPYSQPAMRAFLGHDQDQYVSSGAARSMAKAAYRRALNLREVGTPVVGLACTATIATDRPKKGEHRCCVAVWDGEGATTYDLVLAKGRRDRVGEEEVASRLVLHALARACGLQEDLPLGLGVAEEPREELRVLHISHPDPLRLLAEGAVGTVTVYPDGGMAAYQPIKGAVLPGSYNPLHRGHERLAGTASEILGSPLVFEMSVANVDKPPLEEEEVRRRLVQFRDRWTVVLTRAPRFYQKAGLFPGCTFVIGWDTAVRLVDPKYYGGDEKAMLKAMETIRSAGCRFLVAGRVDGGVFQTLEDVPIPEGFADLFEAIPESRFREDLSSTELRPSREGLRSGPSQGGASDPG